MSIQHNCKLPADQLLSIPILDIVRQDHNHSNITHSFSSLILYGIPTDLSVASNISIIQSILCDIGLLDKTFDLYFPRLNNNIINLFFIPSSLSSKTSFENWDNGGKDINAILSLMSNNNTNRYTEDLVAIDFVLKKYPFDIQNHSIIKHVSWDTLNQQG